MGVFKKVMALMLSLVMIASMSTTMVFAEGQAKGAGVSYVFGGFTRGGPQGDPDPVGISSLVYTAESDPKVLEIAIYDASNMIAGRHLKKKEFTTIEVADASICTLSYFNTPDGTEENASGIKIVPKKVGTTTLTATPKNGEAISINIEIVSLKENYFVMVYDVVENSKDGYTISGAKETAEVRDGPITMIRPFHFAELDGSTDNWIRAYAMDDQSISYTLIRKQVADGQPTVTDNDLKEIFKETKDINGRDALAVVPLKLGTFTLQAEVIVNSKTYTTAPYTLHVIEQRKYINYEIKQNQSINDLLANTAEFPAFGIDDDKDGIDDNYGRTERVIHLKNDGTGEEFKHANDATITLTKPIIIDGENNTLCSQIIVDIPNVKDAYGENLNARLERLTLKARTNRQGTGVTDKETPSSPNPDGTGRRGVMLKAAGITIKDFAIGVDMHNDFILAGTKFINCGIGMNVFVREHGVSISHGREFYNNDTALVIKNNPNVSSNPFALGYAYCNFEGNKKNIVNETTTPYNFSFNYYDGKAEDLAGKFEKVRYSPYYDKAITGGGNNMVLPEKLYIAPAELAEAATTPIPIAKDLAGKSSKIQTNGINGKVKFDLVDMDTASTKSAGWSFDAMANNGVNAFNPAIATELAGSSADAENRIPQDVKYQPVSFAHHGALPGAATISVKPDKNALGTATKLYKVVGNGFELQKDTVTTVNGEFVFNRGDCSDYIITDADLNLPNGNTGNTGSDDDSSGSSNDYTGAGEVTSKLDAAPAGGSVSLDVSSKSNVSASVFAELAQSPGKTLVLRGDGYSWTIKGSDLLSPIAGLLAVNTTISGVSPNAEAIKAITGDAVIQNLYFGYHGNLPFTATINVEVAANLRGKSLNLYHIDGNLKNLMLMESGLVAKDGKVSFPVSSCSDYILTADTIPGAIIGKKAIHNVTNPDTGAKDTVPLAVGIALMSVLGMAVLLKDDKKKK